MNSLGIDVGGMSVKVALQRDGQTIWSGQSPFYRKPTTQQLLDAVGQAIAGRLESVDAVGLCVPGLLDKPNRVITLAVNVPGLMGIPLDKLVADAIGRPLARPVRILNDAVATAHHIYRSRKLTGRLLVLALGTGVGAAVIDQGVSLIVEGESPGHVGQFDVSIEGSPIIGPDGGAGGLEGYIGAAAIARQYGDDTAAAFAKFTGEEPALKALVRAVRICHAIYRPHHIVLSGGIGVRLAKLLPVLRKQIETNLTSVARDGWTFSSGDGDYHAAQGAAMLAAE